MKTKSTGITLLEQLLVIAVFSVITILTAQRYFSYQQQKEIHLIKADIGTIFAALDNYFHLSGCNNDGIFAGKIKPDLMDDLKIHFLLSGSNRYLENFRAEIVKTTLHFANTKPSYQYVISAKAKSLPTPMLNYLANRTNSFYADEEKQLLQWKSLPSASYGKPSSHWILISRLTHMKNQFINAQEVTHANCAQ